MEKGACSTGEGGERCGASEIGWKRAEGATHRVRGLATVSASISSALAGSSDRVWTSGSGEECRSRGVPHLEGEMRRERERGKGGWRPTPLIAVAAGERGGCSGGVELGVPCSKGSRGSEGVTAEEGLR
jgi:hypothetical protein